MACGFPPSNTGNAHEIRRGPDRHLCHESKMHATPLAYERNAHCAGSPLRLFRDEREKIICPIFASLRNAARCALVGVCDGLIENVHRAPPAARGIRDDTEQEPKNLVVQPFVARELAVAYCCGQTGGSCVNAPEITDDFVVQPLWTGGAGCLSSGPRRSGPSNRWSSRRTATSGCVPSNASASTTGASACGRRTAITRNGSRTTSSPRSSRIWKRARSGRSPSTSRSSRRTRSRPVHVAGVRRHGPGRRVARAGCRARPSWSRATRSTSSSSDRPTSSRTRRPGWWPRRRRRAGTRCSSTAASGLGKTHLLQAIGHEIHRQHPDGRSPSSPARSS